MLSETRQIEKSIIKKFRKQIWSKFIRAIDEFQLISDNDKIAVCISGGKDSMLLAKCFQELERHGRKNFSLEFIVMDPGYDKKNLDLIKSNLDKLGIPANIFKSTILNVTEKIENPCYLCARMRRGYLYARAKELGCNKIALGHHFDDVIETIMLNIIYAGEYKTMMPKLVSQNFEDMELIRPFYFIKEKDIIAWAKYNNLEFINCACAYTKKKVDGKRKEIKKLIESLVDKYENADINILRSSYNINLDAIIEYKVDGKKINFLDNYKK